jgi:hypothetical protein
MSIEENKAIVRRLFDEVWNTGKLDKIEELYPYSDTSRTYTLDTRIYG